jgi:hypothetical protein
MGRLEGSNGRWAIAVNENNKKINDVTRLMCMRLDKWFNGGY